MIHTHAELLAAYAQAALSLIWENSGSISDDARKLRDEVEDYASTYGLPLPDIDWSLSILEED